MEAKLKKIIKDNSNFQIRAKDKKHSSKISRATNKRYAQSQLETSHDATWVKSNLNSIELTNNPESVRDSIEALPPVRGFKKGKKKKLNGFVRD